METKLTEIIIDVLKSMEEETRPSVLEYDYSLNKLMSKIILEEKSK